MIVPPKVSLSTIAAQSLGSVNVFVQPEKDSFDAMATHPLPQLESFQRYRIGLDDRCEGDRDFHELHQIGAFPRRHD